MLLRNNYVVVILMVLVFLGFTAGSAQAQAKCPNIVIDEEGLDEFYETTDDRADCGALDLR
jgi:hypothetical protein